MKNCDTMENSIRSGGGIVKKKSSSGCLIIKKKGGVDGGGGGGGGGGGLVGSSRDRGSVYKEKKRPRLVMSGDSSSSEESFDEGIRRKVNEKYNNGGSGYRRSGGEDKEIIRNGGFESERKRSRVDLYDFHEYENFEGKRVSEEYDDDRLKMVNSRDFGGGTKREYMNEKRKHSIFDSPRSKVVDYSGKNKSQLDEDEAHLPISLLKMKYQESNTDEPIRLQGKNGVLKVMVNKKKKMNVLASKSEGVIKKEIDLRVPFHSELKSRKLHDWDGDETDTLLKLGPPSLHHGSSSSSKGVKLQDIRGKEVEESMGLIKGKEEKKNVNESITTQTRGKEVKVVKRGGSTEKQQLRERIREMLLKAGWTIDYRPRRNRDYLDAVYINPNGTAYWSIIKAYDALQKQWKDQPGKTKAIGISSSTFAPLSEDLISKLTRQTRKKIEEEMKKKRREDILKRASGIKESDNEETLGSYIRQNRKTLKDKITESESSDNSCKRTLIQDRIEKTSMVQGRKSKIFGRCTLLVRNSDKGTTSEKDGYIPYTGKRTVLAWLIDSGRVQLSQKVQYMNRRRTRVKLEGWITRDGIHCGCCSKILSVSKFELHAGSKLRQPFQNIFLESGVSLLQCQIDAWNIQDKSDRQDFFTIKIDGDDPDDDACGICGDGGDLICCDSCPSTFHLTCLEIQMLPPGDWHCPNCICKFCGTSRGNIELMMCSLCERKYHKSCGEEIDGATSNFCGPKCQELHENLQKIIGVKHELEAGFSWSVIQRTDIEGYDVSNRGYAQRVECNSKLAVALSVMDECFLPIIDRRSGINIIHNVLYNCGANFNRLNYRGFYTVILERGDEIISVASIRIHGSELAEMPFIGTRGIYRRQGMCRRLLSAIESVLSCPKVENLIIPAISEHMHTWRVIFGFKPLEGTLKKQMKSMNMLVFPGTDMLEKKLVREDIMQDGNDKKDGVELKENDSLKQPDLNKTSDGMDSGSSDSGSNTSDAQKEEKTLGINEVEIKDIGSNSIIKKENEEIKSIKFTSDLNEPSAIEGEGEDEISVPLNDNDNDKDKAAPQVGDENIESARALS